jgi:hypothetical protein
MIPQIQKILHELSLTPSLLEERDDCIVDTIRVSFPNILQQVTCLQNINNDLKKLWYESRKPL